MRNDLPWLLLLLLSAIIYASFLFGAIDEILTLVAYCGRTCLYPYPIGPALDFYRAEEVADIMVVLSTMGIVISFYEIAETNRK